MDMSDDMILLVDRKTLRFIDVNETVCRNLGYSREAFLAMTPEDILPVTRKELEAAYDEMIATGSTQGLRSEYRCKDGSKLPFESRRRVIPSRSTSSNKPAMASVTKVGYVTALCCNTPNQS